MTTRRLKFGKRPYCPQCGKYIKESEFTITEMQQLADNVEVVRKGLHSKCGTGVWMLPQKWNRIRRS